MIPIKSHKQLIVARPQQLQQWQTNRVAGAEWVDDRQKLPLLGWDVYGFRVRTIPSLDSTQHEMRRGVRVHEDGTLASLALFLATCGGASGTKGSAQAVFLTLNPKARSSVAS